MYKLYESRLLTLYSHLSLPLSPFLPLLLSPFISPSLLSTLSIPQALSLSMGRSELNDTLRQAQIAMGILRLFGDHMTCESRDTLLSPKWTVFLAH